MAVNGNQFNPDDQTQQQGQGGATSPQSGGVNISGSEASDNNIGAPSTNQSSPKATSSGRFQNLNSYLKANQNFNNQGGGLAGKLNQNLTSKANDLQKNFATAQQDYQTSLNNARQRYDANFVNTSLQDPTKVSDADTQKFANMRDATYKGPTSLDPNVQTQADNFSNLAGNTGSEQGRFNLLRNIYNTPTYSAGQQSLDNLFLQGNPNQLAQLQNNRITANQVNNSLGQAQAQAAASATDATNEANDTRTNTRNALSGAITGFDSNMTNAVQNALTNRNSTYLKEQNALLGSGVNSADALKFGLINKLGDASSVPLYNLDLSKYLSQSDFAPTNQNVASQDDYNRINALGKLAGNALDENTSKILDTYKDPSLVGSFAQQDPYNFNKQQFQYDVGNSQANYQDALNPLQGQLAAYNADLYGGGAGEGSGYEGGFTGEVGRRAQILRDQLNVPQNYTQEYAQKNGLPYIDYNGMNASDLLNQYGNKNQARGGDTWLTHAIDVDKQEAYNRQASIDQLMNSSGINRKLNITDASQYAPVSVAQPPRVDTSGGTNEPAINQLALLNNIYNR